MKHFIIITIISVMLQGCLTGVAGFMDGSSNNFISSHIRKAKYEHKEFLKKRDRELYKCKYETAPTECTQDTYVKSCDLEYYKSVELYYTCEILNGNETYHFYTLAETNDDIKVKRYIYDYPENTLAIQDTIQ